jgi:protein SMG6
MSRPHGRPAPTPKSSGDYISASSTSSYANSMASSAFTLSSNTDSSTSSALFERQGQPSEEPGNNVFAVQLKKLYRAITALETKIKAEDLDEVEDSRVHIKGKEVIDEEKERQKWKNQIQDHKRYVYHPEPVNFNLTIPQTR